MLSTWRNYKYKMLVFCSESTAAASKLVSLPLSPLLPCVVYSSGQIKYPHCPREGAGLTHLTEPVSSGTLAPRTLSSLILPVQYSWTFV